MILTSSVIASPSNVTLEVGQWYYGASVTVYPANASAPMIKWCSNNTSVATVGEHNGYICAVGKGTAIIYAMANDGSNKKDCIKVTVVDKVKVNSITLNENNLILQEGMSYTVNANVSPTTASDKTLNWTSENTDVATVNNDGVVTAKSVGTAIIKASAADGSGVTAQYSVAVTSNILVNSITVTPSSKVLSVGAAFGLKATVLPTNATKKSVRWISSNPEIVQVNPQSGFITAIKGGRTSIYAKALDGSGVVGLCSVTVNYCGGSDYKNAKNHSFELQDDGYYVCSRCGYRIMSPDVQDFGILTHEDYLLVVALHWERLLYLMEGYTEIGEAMLRVIDKIRSRDEYKCKYAYSDSNGRYVSPYEYVFDSYNMHIRVDMTKLETQAGCLAVNDGLARIIVTLGSMLPDPYGLVLSFISMGLESETPFSDALLMGAEEIEKQADPQVKLFKLLGIVSTAFNIYSIYNEVSGLLGDTYVTITVMCPYFEREGRYTFEDCRYAKFTSQANVDNPNPYDTLVMNGWWDTQWKNIVFFEGDTMGNVSDTDRITDTLT